MKNNLHGHKSGKAREAGFGSRVIHWAWIAGFLLLSAGSAWPGEQTDIATQLRQLKEQNERLQQQLHKQQELIEVLALQMATLQKANAQPTSETREQNEEISNSPIGLAAAVKPLSAAKINLSGEAGFAFLVSGSEGQFPNSEFRVDEARLFIEAEALKDVYVYAELNLTLREDPDDYIKLGEAYIDFESVSKLWNRERQMNLRFGRFYIPFGEEYQVRYAIDNPLVSHSLSDLWGVDEGIELYGELGRFQYAVAVQNGGHPSLHDFTGDKSVAARVGYDPAKWLHLSASAMRTGDLNATDDLFSEMWFGNGFFRALGQPATTTKFHANLLEGDVHVRLPRGHLKAAGGYVDFDDNDISADNHRNLYYYYAEGLYNVAPKLYAAARFSQIFAPAGYPIVGHGDFGQYLFRGMATDLWRLSLGAGYRLSPNAVVKAEYSLERGKETSGVTREHEDLFGFEVAVKF